MRTPSAGAPRPAVPRCPVDQRTAPHGQLRELRISVHRHPPGVSFVRRQPLGGESLPQLAEAPHAGQDGGGELSEGPRRRGPNEEVGVCLARRRLGLSFQLLRSNAEVAGVGPVKLHLALQSSLRQVCETAHRLQVSGPRNAVGEDPRIVDEEQVVLAHPVLQSHLVQGPAAYPLDEGMVKLGIPVGFRDPVEPVGKPLFGFLTLWLRRHRTPKPFRRNAIILRVRRHDSTTPDADGKPPVQ